ncbi:hypothetical protein BHE74_00016088 [Ensete ventricosum]|nr:hypothetical protein BHE74_00016088 [Ensete ventricosum]
MRLGTRLEYVGSSPRVSGACQDGTREFDGRRLRLAERLSGVAERLAGSWEGIGKIIRNTLGDRRRRIVRLVARQEEEEKKKKKKRSTSRRRSGDSARGSPASRRYPRCPLVFFSLVSPRGREFEATLRDLRRSRGRLTFADGYAWVPDIVVSEQDKHTQKHSPYKRRGPSWAVWGTASTYSRLGENGH